MSPEEKETALDRAIAGIRNEQADPAEVSGAAARVWQRIAEEAAAPQEVELIRTCADYRALIPAFRAGKLSPARALLVEDHLRECPGCRRSTAPQPMETIPLRTPAWKWAFAAAVAAAAVLVIVSVADFGAGGAGPRAALASVDGAVYRVAGAALAPGAVLAEGEGIRTAKGSSAVVRLRDGSLVEMTQRTEIAVTERREGMTIRLAGGSIIVQAAKQRPRHLYVATDDCLVSVTGTVFAVNHGIKGSRVSVVEGEVHVSQGQDTKVLHPGDQVSTTTAVAPVPVRDEIAWSRNADQYVALLGEFAKLRQKIEALPGPGLRYSSRLLPLVPAGTVFYAAIPNIGTSLGEAQRLFREQLAQSDVLRQWWEEKVKAAGADQKFDEALARIRAFSDYLGPEIVIALTKDANGEADQPLILAEVTRSGFREFLDAQIRSACLEGGECVQVINDPMHAAPGGDKAFVYIAGNIVAGSPEIAALQQVAAAGAAGSGFTGTDFGGRVARAYRDGVGWLFAADLQALMASGHGKDKDLAASGFGDLRYLIAERKEVAGKTENSAVLAFAQPRRGVASWLATPAPSRALEFVSPDATLAVAAVVKNPAQMIDDVAAMAGGQADFLKSMGEFHAKTGLDPRADILAPLGGDMAFAIDGPMLPVPAWKLAVEVYDAAKVQNAIERLVESANREAGQKPGWTPVTLGKEQASGRTIYSLSGMKAGFEAHYTFDGGYLVAAPTRDLLDRALQYRATGYTLEKSAKFTSLLPQDGNVNFSAVIYNAVGNVLGPLAQGIQMTPEQQKALAAVAGAPTMVVIYGEQDRIQVSSKGSFFGFNLENMLFRAGMRGPRS